MRTQLFNPSVSLLKYGIREVVDTAQKIKELDPSHNFIWENIGDPIAKGWPVPAFLKDLIIEEVQKPKDEVFGYCHSRGIISTRKWVVEYVKRYAPSSELDYENVLFTSGLGAAIASTYDMLPHGSRILQPTPAYPSHNSMESFAANAEPILYNLDPDNGWEPDFGHLESQIKAHPEVVGILIINPNNPTGAVYSKETLEKMVVLAERYNLMIISDEIYFRMVYNGHHHTQIIELAKNRVPLLVMRGLSKDVPWPGGRSGWLEFHNTHLDEEYRNYCESLKKRVLMEVCSGTLPQTLLPRIYDHPDFAEWSKHYNAGLQHTSNTMADILSKVKGLKVNRTNGAFYMMPLFEKGLLNSHQTLPIENPTVRAYIEKEVSKPDFPVDQRFTYYLLGNTGIVTVPASGFFSPFPGFRVTTLERDEAKRQSTYTQLTEAIGAYLNS